MTYRVVGLDGATRILRDRARPRRLANGSVLVEGIISDITAREEAAARLDEASDRFASLLDVVGAHVYLALALPDGQMEELFQGPGGDRLLGGAEPDPEMINWDAAVHADDRPAYDAFNHALGRGEDSEVTYRLIGADGITRWVYDRAACRPRPDGTFEVSGIVSDVTERRRLEDELKRSMREMKVAHRELERARADAEVRAGTDELTGTFNRRHFAQIATETLAANAAACGLLLLDADNFKQINDAYGHAVGDAVLIDLAHRLSAGLEPGDCLARWGGEEFAILLPGACSADELVRRAESFRHAVSDSPIVNGDVHLDLTISVGGALAPEHGATLDALLETGRQLPVRREAPGTKLRLAAPGRRALCRRTERRAECRRVGTCPGVRVQPPGRHPAGARRGGRPSRRPDGRTPGAARSRRAALPARRMAARRREARGSRAHPEQARAAGRRRVGSHAHASRCRRRHRCTVSLPSGRSRLPYATITSATAATATRTISPDRPSPSKRASSPPRMPTPR